MKLIQMVAALGILATLNSVSISSRAAEADGVAIAIVYDTSGSMNEPVRDAGGKMTPKYVIANRALNSIAARIESFATNKTSGRAVESGLFTFRGSGSKEAVPFGPFQAKAFQDWASASGKPDGATPLGAALTDAGKAVLRSSLARKHVLLITDGDNTVGPKPAEAMAALQKEAAQSQGTVSVHFIAFDVDAKIFSDVKQLGATVVSASNETQLRRQLEFVLAKKILLEDEEPAKKN